MSGLLHEERFKTQSAYNEGQLLWQDSPSALTDKLNMLGYFNNSTPSSFTRLFPLYDASLSFCMAKLIENKRVACERIK